MSHKSPPVYRSNPFRFFRGRLRPGKAVIYQEMVAWHWQAAQRQTYPLEHYFPEHQRQQLIQAASQLKEGGPPVRLQFLEYSKFAHLSPLKPFFRQKAGESLEVRVNRYLCSKRKPEYTTWQSRDQLIAANMEAIFLRPTADALDEHWPQLSRVDANYGRTIHSLFLENLRCLFICSMATLIFESKGTTRLLQHLLEATRYCLPLCFDKKDSSTLHILVP